MNKKEKIKESIRLWLSNKYNLYFLAILFLALIIRIYFFTLTKGQALWWDEAEYLLKAKNIALGTPDTGFWPGRPILFPIILSFFYFIGFEETGIRIFMIIISLASITLMYLLSKKLFNEKIGLITSFLFSMIYVNLFYTMRIMNDVLVVFLGMLAYYFYFTKKPRLIWLVFPILAIATLIRFPAFFFFVILAIYILITEKKEAFRNKNYWISALLALVVGVPYLLWQKIKFGHFLFAVKEAGSGSIGGITLSYGISNTKQYLMTFPSYFHSILLTLFVIGLYVFFEVFIGFDRILKNKNSKLSVKLLMLLWIIIPIIYFGFAVSHYEDRYIFMAFPSIFIVIALASMLIYGILRKYNQKIAAVLIIILIAAGGWQLLSHSNDIINARVGSYGPVKEAGLWLKERSSPEDVVLARSHPQITYYAERETYTVDNDEQIFASDIENHQPRFIIISIFERHADWAYNNFDATKYGVVPVKTFPSVGQPQLIIYERQTQEN